MASYGTSGTHDVKETVRRAEVVKTTKLEPTVPAPPRPSGDGSVPNNREEWKDLLARAAPWLIAAAVVALGAGALNKAEEEEGSVGLWGRKKGRQAGDAARDAKNSAKRGWFGLKREAGGAGEDAKGKWQDTKATAKDKWQDTKAAAKDKAGQAKDGASNAGSYVADKAADLAEASKQAALRAEHTVAKAGSKLGAAASGAEETTGRALKDAGSKLERDGSEGRRQYKGDAIKHDLQSKPWWQFW
ncbi:hypothetical protein ACKKBG_A31530 [Auxenochlorella protothecoides x Auxenochlorella symbiontica]|uniref:Uncharacterized protein n=2 Tax=Auxenochlorella protothecoides TaxID=3075 RepID=A0A087SS72_AUXPR|nr:hypothetical protein F751_0317 [Auxenochlorella protothecoides]KFM28576.1 hypothetical protein F751_0317 [Auxenochlorella protothecoides]RMZ53305.1 hypothetical protein APUTEX25_004793 [Auxenochlorella protothecoides]|eukprot:RMZ53305.1 hypothetical protein APUTEX25_004793 [Auxenochlorella protothecoides]